jgi:hypothetical protein
MIKQCFTDNEGNCNEKPYNFKVFYNVNEQSLRIIKHYFTGNEEKIMEAFGENSKMFWDFLLELMVEIKKENVQIIKE